jgi:cytidine deaminase
MKSFFFFFFSLAALQVFSIPQNSTTELVEKAMTVRQNSYSPYSNYKVGAALKTLSGKIFVGTNVENASYGMTICAERSAVFSAVSSGEKSFESIAIATKDGGSPCGGCRQVLNEFNPDMEIILVNEQGSVTKKCKLCELLSGAFGPKNLK